MRRLALFLILTASLLHAQQRVENMRVARGPGMRRAEQAKLNITPEEKQRAEQIIANSVGAARGIEDSGGRAYALLQVARALQTSDKKTATELLEEALTAARSVEEDRADTRQRLQRQILKVYVALAPARADKMVDELDIDGRKDVLTSLLAYYEKNKQTDRALEVLYRIGQESEIPYDSAARLIRAMKPEQSADAQELFAAALNSYRIHGKDSQPLGPGSFADMVAGTWEKASPGMVKAAIDAILDQAQTLDKSSGNRQMNLAMMSDKGGVQFSSQYELALFQLAPILKRVAPSEAESRLRDNQAARESLARFPQGMSSFGPPPGAEGDSGPRMMMTMDAGDRDGSAGAPNGPPPGMPSPMEMVQVSKIVSSARTHPQDALAQASMISNATAKSDAYVGIARTTVKTDKSVAKQALDKAMELKVADPQLAILRLDEAADLYLQLGEEADAKKVVEKKMDAAEAAYETDTNPDKPNTALKAYWPSTASWRSALSTAVRISPEWAQSLLKDISDPEIRTLNQIALASMMLEVPAEPVTVITQTKDGTSIMSTDVSSR